MLHQLILAINESDPLKTWKILSTLAWLFALFLIQAITFIPTEGISDGLLRIILSMTVTLVYLARRLINKNGFYILECVLILILFGSLAGLSQPYQILSNHCLKLSQFTRVSYHVH